MVADKARNAAVGVRRVVLVVLLLIVGGCSEDPQEWKWRVPLTLCEQIKREEPNHPLRRGYCHPEELTTPEFTRPKTVSL